MFHNPDGVYFVSFAVVDWTVVFSVDLYCNIILESLSFCQKYKGMEIFEWCIMPNHIHLIYRSMIGIKPEQILGDFKRFTSKAIVRAIIDNHNENRKEKMLQLFQKHTRKSSNVNEYQFWQHNNHPVELWSNKALDQKIDYIHYNPVKKGFLSNPEDYKYSSAKNYCGMTGLLDGVVVII